MDDTPCQNSEVAENEVEFDQTDSAMCVVEGEEEERVEYYCGIGWFKPKCLQVFRNPYFFSFLLCSDVFFSGALSTGNFVLCLSYILVITRPMTRK